MRALILGGAACLLDDVRKVARLGGWAVRDVRDRDGLVWPVLVDFPGVMIAVNNAGFAYPGPLDHWDSLHADNFRGWIPERRRRGYAMSATIWSHTPNHNVERVLSRGYIGDPANRRRESGSSGFHAGRVAQLLAQEASEALRGTFCGVPMDVSPHFDGPGSRDWRRKAQTGAYWQTWLACAATLGDLRSMSGRTRDLLGAPDAAWLA